jgi:hypothetical protein
MGSSTLEIYGGSLNIAQTPPTSIAFLSTLFHRYLDTHTTLTTPSVNSRIDRVAFSDAYDPETDPGPGTHFQGPACSSPKPSHSALLSTLDTFHTPNTDYPAGSSVGISHITQLFNLSEPKNNVTRTGGQEGSVCCCSYYLFSAQATTKIVIPQQPHY